MKNISTTAFLLLGTVYSSPAWVPALLAEKLDSAPNTSLDSEIRDSIVSYETALSELDTSFCSCACNLFGPGFARNQSYKKHSLCYAQKCQGILSIQLF